jgi:hypothetical protein
VNNNVGGKHARDVCLLFSPNSSEIFTVPNMKTLYARHGHMQYILSFMLVYAYFKDDITSRSGPHALSAQGLQLVSRKVCRTLATRSKSVKGPRRSSGG